MYISKLETYTNKDWKLFFKQFPALSHVEKKEVVQILTLPTKEAIEASFDRLFELKIINGL